MLGKAGNRLADGKRCRGRRTRGIQNVDLAGTFLDAEVVEKSAPRAERLGPDARTASDQILGPHVGNETLAFSPDGTLYTNNFDGSLYITNLDPLGDVFFTSTSTEIAGSAIQIPAPAVITLLGIAALRSRRRR